MLLEIVTPDKAVFKGEVKLVRFPGSLGSFATLKNHAPIISTLQKGTLKTIDMEGEEDFFDIGGGVMEMNKNHIIVLAENA